MISDGGLLTILYIVQSDLKAITIPGYYCIELHLLPNELFILFYTCHILIIICMQKAKQASKEKEPVSSKLQEVPEFYQQWSHPAVSKAEGPSLSVRVQTADLV